MTEIDWFYGTDSITGQERWSAEAYDAKLEVWKSVLKLCGYVWFIDFGDAIRFGFRDTSEDAQAKAIEVAERRLIPKGVGTKTS